MGLLKNDAFIDIRQFAKDALDWMAKFRLKEAEKRREKERIKSPQISEKTKDKLTKIIDEKVPDKRTKNEIKKVVNKYEQSVSREAKSLREDLQLYRSLATAGTTSAVFAHESSKPISIIKKLSEAIKRKSQQLLGKKYKQYLEKPITMLIESSKSLHIFAQLPIYLLKRDKRRFGLINVHEVIDDVMKMFNPFLIDSKIKAAIEKADNELYIKGSIALLEAIIANLITNTVNAFNVKGARNIDRKLIIRTELSGDWVLLKILDNGPGIQDIEIDEIWLPGRTTTAGGTGFGLTIVKDSVSDLGGKVHAIANGEIGGAEFVIQLPVS